MLTFDWLMALSSWFGVALLIYLFSFSQFVYSQVTNEKDQYDANDNIAKYDSARETIEKLCLFYRHNKQEEAFDLFDVEMEADLSLFNSYGYASWAGLFSWRHDFNSFFTKFAADFRRQDIDCRIKSCNERPYLI